MNSNDILLINQDCYEFIKTIPDKSIDLIYTDPPYDFSKSGGHTGGGAFGSKKKEYHNELDNANIDRGFNLEILNEFKRVLKSIYIFGVIKTKYMII